MAITTYPVTFPCPLIQGYRSESDMGVLRADFDNGRSRQRRKYTTMPTRIQMLFTVPLTALNMWQIWVNEFAYDWFYCPAVTYANADPAHPHDSPVIVRFISDLSWSPATADFVTITVRAEMAPENATATGETGVWIVGRRPANPAVNVIVGGTPGNPALP